jgi:hypothetical protein
VRVLGQAADALRLRLDGATLRDVASRIEWRKVAMRTIEQDAAAHPEGLSQVAEHPHLVVDDRRRGVVRQLRPEEVQLGERGRVELRDVASRIEWRKVAMRTIEQDAAAHPEGLSQALDPGTRPP